MLLLFSSPTLHSRCWHFQNHSVFVSLISRCSVRRWVDNQTNNDDSLKAPRPKSWYFQNYILAHPESEAISVHAEELFLVSCDAKHILVFFQFSHHPASWSWWAVPLWVTHTQKEFLNVCVLLWHTIITLLVAPQASKGQHWSRSTSVWWWAW